MAVLAILIATILDITTLLTLIVSVKTKSLTKVVLAAVIAALTAELINALVRPTYEPSGAIFYRLIGQLLVGLCAYNLARVLRRGTKKVDAPSINTEAPISQTGQGSPEPPLHSTQPPLKEYLSHAIGFDADGFFGDMKRLLSFSLSWSERTVLEKSYTCLFTLIIVALFPMPYEFYSSLRVMMWIGLYFYFQAILPERLNKPIWFWTVIGLFIVYNPVVPLQIGKQAVWAFINFATIYVLYRARLIFDKTESSKSQ